MFGLVLGIKSTDTQQGHRLHKVHEKEKSYSSGMAKSKNKLT